MTFNEMIGFLNQWMSTFGSFIDILFTRIGDLTGSVGQTILPQFIQDLTLFGVIFGAGFTIFIGYTLVKWVTDLIA